GVGAGGPLDLAPDADVSGLFLANNLLHPGQGRVRPGGEPVALAPLADLEHGVGQDEAAASLDLLPYHVAEGPAVGPVVESGLEVEGDHYPLGLGGRLPGWVAGRGAGRQEALAQDGTQDDQGQGPAHGVFSLADRAGL